MECTAIKECLSEYIDGQLDAETEASVQRHLASCQACAAELASIKALVDELGDLDPVLAPANFLDQLHQRIEEPSRFSKFIRALFVPFKIKVPLEFAGAAAAVLVFIVLNVQQPKDALRHRPMALTHEEPAREVAPTGPAPHRLETEKRARHAQEISPAGTKPPATIKAPEPLLAGEDLKENELTAKPIPIELVLVIPTELPRQRAAAPSVDSVPPDSRPAQSTTKKGLRAFGRARPKAAEEESETPAVLGGEGLSDKDQALPSSRRLKRIRALVTLNHGRVLSVGYEENTQVPRSILVDMPAHRFSLFSEGLRELGYLKTPPRIPAQEIRERIQVSIRFLYPG